MFGQGCIALDADNITIRMAEVKGYLARVGLNLRGSPAGGKNLLYLLNLGESVLGSVSPGRLPGLKIQEASLVGG